MKMKYGTSYSQGDIVLIPFPFTDLSHSKKRPALVLSNKKYNKETEDFIVCGITSNLKDRRYSVLITKKDLEKGFIPKKSIIKVDKIINLKQTLAIKKIGKVKNIIIKNIKKNLLELI